MSNQIQSNLIVDTKYNYFDIVTLSNFIIKKSFNKY